MHVKAAAGRGLCLPSCLVCQKGVGYSESVPSAAGVCARTVHVVATSECVLENMGKQNIPVGRVVAVRRAGTRSKSIQKYSGLEFQQASLGLSLRPSRSSSVRDTLV